MARARGRARASPAALPRRANNHRAWTSAFSHPKSRPRSHVHVFASDAGWAFLGIVAQALLIFTTRVPSLRSPELYFCSGSGKVLLRKKEGVSPMLV